MTKLLGVQIPHDSKKLLTNSSKPSFIVTLNPEILLRAHRDLAYQRIINSADTTLIDGVGIVIIMRLLYGKRIIRTTGVDFARNLVRKAAKQSRQALLVGGSAPANSAAAKNLGIQGFGGDFLWHEAMRRIIAIKPDILLVAMGAPKQEQFIHILFTTYPQRQLPRIALGIGGAVDFWAYPGLRAPRILQHLGLEWLWRLLREPWRMKRIFRAVVLFPLACLHEWLLVKLHYTNV